MNKQELENKIIELENNIKVSQNAIEELKKAIVNVEEKAWKPEGEERYYCVEGMKTVIYYNNSQFDKDMISTGNYFKTEKQAERALFEQNLRLKLRKFAEDNNDKIDWNNVDDMNVKWNVIFNYSRNKIQVSNCCTTRQSSQIYFSSREIAEKAIEQFHDELIKYFTEEL